MKAVNKGFTLIEIMVAVGIIGILAAIAYPSYADYVIRGRIPEGLTALSDARVQMERFFLDNRRYRNNMECSNLVGTLQGKHFSLSCDDISETTYTITATGNVGKMDGFEYTINERNERNTNSVKTGWTLTVDCWVLKRDGSCG
jgi:type IV pilus assembly protein PilE